MRAGFAPIFTKNWYRASPPAVSSATKAAPDEAGDTWTWTALDSDSKLIVSWLVGGRDSEYAISFMDDLRSRLANRVQLTTDGHKAYLEAVEGAFGYDVDYAPACETIRRTDRARRAMSASTAPRSVMAPESAALRVILTQRLSARHMRSARTLRCGCKCAASPA